MDLIIHLLHKPGHFVWRSSAVAEVWPGDGKGRQRPPEQYGRVDQRLDKQIRRTFRLGKQRTPTQDVEYAVNQLAEMALRAMSPAINDPFTAMNCLDYLGQGLALFAQKGEETSHIYDQDGRLRLVFEPVPFDELLDAAFDMLRHASCDNAGVLLHMLRVIDAIRQETKSLEARQKLLQHISLIQAESQAGALIEQDRQHIQRNGEALQMKLAKTIIGGNGIDHLQIS